MDTRRMRTLTRRGERTREPYGFALLDPRPGADNSALFATGSVLGIEVTIPFLAERCGLGNVDPQHAGRAPQIAAIEVALRIPLPPAGTTLATIRPDIDAVGAMAALVLRDAGHWSASAEGRARAIADADAGERGAWPGQHDFPPAVGSRLAGIASIVSDPRLPLPERVERMADWLTTGRCRGLREADAAAAAAIRETARETSVELASSGRIALVRSRHRGAVGTGYRFAPIVVAVSPAHRIGDEPPHRKLTIGQYGRGWVDLGAVADALAQIELGWGGTPLIIGSPQGRASVISVEEAVATVEHFREEQPAAVASTRAAVGRARSGSRAGSGQAAGADHDLRSTKCHAARRSRGDLERPRARQRERTLATLPPAFAY